MKFVISRYNIKVKSCCVGSRFVNSYRYAFNDVGKKVLIKDGKENIYEIIQSHKDDNNLARLFKRYCDGDLSVFDSNKGIYIDTTELPTSFDQLQDKLLDIRSKFDSSPIDIKNLFGNDFNYFVNSVKDGKVLDILQSNKDVFNRYFKIDDFKSDVKTDLNSNDVNKGGDFVESKE